VKIVEIPGVVTSVGHGSDRSLPDLAHAIPADAKPVTKRFKSWGRGLYAVTLTSYSSAALWNGHSMYCTGWGAGH
jgi:hypothetical protein